MWVCETPYRLILADVSSVSPVAKGNWHCNFELVLFKIIYFAFKCENNLFSDGKFTKANTFRLDFMLVGSHHFANRSVFNFNAIKATVLLRAFLSFSRCYFSV